METNAKPSVGIVGGTGALGSGLAKRLAKAGYSVLIGSRKPEAAEAACKEILEQNGDQGLLVLAARDNVAAATESDIVFVTVPFSAHAATLESIKDAVPGKVVVDVTVPLMPPKVARVQLPPEGSAGQIAQAILGEAVHVVSALQNVAAHHLNSDDPIDCDVLVTGNEKSARQTVIDILADINVAGYHAGLINNAAAAEALTSILLTLISNIKPTRASRSQVSIDRLRSTRYAAGGFAGHTNGSGRR